MPAITPPFDTLTNFSNVVQTTYKEPLPKSATSILQLKAQWTKPSDILSLSLLLGPDVI